MSMFTWSSLTPVWPELFLALSAMLFLIVGVWRGNDGTLMLCRGAMGAFAVTAMFIMGLDWSVGQTLSGMFVMDQFAGFTKLMVLMGLIAAMALSMRYLYQEDMARFEYPVLVMFAGLGMMLMISAHNLLTMYVGMELQSFSLYVLAVIRHNHAKSAEAGMKYFVLGALASGLLLFGISLVYGYTGAIDFGVIGLQLAEASTPGTGLVVGLVFILTSVTALFAIVPKVAAMALLMRLLFDPFHAVLPEWQQVIWVLSLASMLVGAFAGIVQKNIKRLMAYSSIGNMGYALIGVAAGTVEGVGAVLAYMMIYMIMTAGTFGIILSMRIRGRACDDIEDLSGLSRTAPLLAWSLAFLMFSMSGIPPLAGFFGKLFIFQAAIEADMIVLAVLGILTSVVAAFYYLRIIKVMFFDEPTDNFDGDMGFALRAVIFMSILFVLFFILSPDILVETARSAATALFAG